MLNVEIYDIAQIVISVTGSSCDKDTMDENTLLLGVMPEMDSMAIINTILALESRYHIDIDDEDVEQSVFESVGSLRRFVEAKLVKDISSQGASSPEQ